ncbi:N-acetyltransferase, partial [Escherichia coli]|nr:N-acetyltransferase [Escherichia coli]
MLNDSEVSVKPVAIQEAIHDYLSQSSWAPGIDIETVSVSIQNSLCFGL